MTFDDVLELLPESATALIDVIGIAQTKVFIEKFGGVEIQFTNGNVYAPKIIECLGEEDAKKVLKHFKNEKLYIPRCSVATRTLRNLKFKAEFEFLTKEKGISGRLAMIELCPKYNISDRAAWEIVKITDTVQGKAIQQSIFEID